MEKEIMDVTEELAENNVDVVAEIVEAADTDWTKYGIVAGGVALVVAGAYGAYKLLPKAVESIKTWKADHTKQEHTAKYTKCVVGDTVVTLIDDEDDK